MLRFVCNTEAINYYSKSTFIVTLIKHENLVFILIFYTFRSIYMFFQDKLQVPRYIQIYPISGVRFLNKNKRTALTPFVSISEKPKVHWKKTNSPVIYTILGGFVS